MQSDSPRLFCMTAAIAGQTECLEHSVSLHDESKNRSTKATIWMLGKIPLVKGFVIFTKFYDCALHIRAPWSLQSVPELQQVSLWAFL